MALESSSRSRISWSSHVAQKPRLLPSYAIRLKRGQRPSLALTDSRFAWSQLSWNNPRHGHGAGNPTTSADGTPGFRGFSRARRRRPGWTVDARQRERSRVLRLLSETWHAPGWDAAANPPLRGSLDTVERPPDQAGRNN